MRKLTWFMVAAFVTCAIAPAGKCIAMDMPKAGEETKAISKIFTGNWSWTGDIAAGSMGPDSPAIKSHGHVSCKAILGGLWYECDVEDKMGTGKDAMTWKGDMYVGYDLTSKSYRSMCVDNLGAMTEYKGALDGDKFVLETPDEVMMMGQMMKDRLSWDWSDPSAVKFLNEHKMTGGDWIVVENAVMKRERLAATTHAGMKAPASSIKSH